MRIQYTGNNVFALPLGRGQYKSFKKNQTHDIPDEVWAERKQKGTTKYYYESGELRELSKPQDKSVGTLASKKLQTKRELAEELSGKDYKALRVLVQKEEDVELLNFIKEFSESPGITKAIVKRLGELEEE